MHAMKNDTHPLPCRNQSRNTDDPANGSQRTPASTRITECDENGDDDTEENRTNAETASKDDAGTIAVADSPANEIGVSLTAECHLRCRSNHTESRRVSSIFKGSQKCTTLAGG